AGEAGAFRAFLHGKRFSDLRFVISAHGAMPQLTSPGEGRLGNFDPGGGSEGGWGVTPRPYGWEGETGRSGEGKRAVAAKHYSIETTIGKNNHLNSTTEVQFDTVKPGARVLRMSLLPALRVSKITDGEGHEIGFIQEDRKQDGSLYAILPEATQA